MKMNISELSFVINGETIKAMLFIPQKTMSNDDVPILLLPDTLETWNSYFETVTVLVAMGKMIISFIFPARKKDTLFTITNTKIFPKMLLYRADIVLQMLERLGNTRVDVIAISSGCDVSMIATLHGSWYFRNIILISPNSLCEKKSYFTMLQCAYRKAKREKAFFDTVVNREVMARILIGRNDIHTSMRGYHFLEKMKIWLDIFSSKRVDARNILARITAQKESHSVALITLSKEDAVNRDSIGENLDNGLMHISLSEIEGVAVLYPNVIVSTLTNALDRCADRLYAYGRTL